MNADQSWKEHLELDRKLHESELRFARAVIRCEESRGNNPRLISEIAEYHKEIIISKCEMKRAEQAYIKNCEYLDSINFIA